MKRNWERCPVNSHDYMNTDMCIATLRRIHELSAAGTGEQRQIEVPTVPQVDAGWSWGL